MRVLGMTLNCIHTVVRPDRNVFCPTWTLGDACTRRHYSQLHLDPGRSCVPGCQLWRNSNTYLLPCRSSLFRQRLRQLSLSKNRSGASLGIQPVHSTSWVATPAADPVPNVVRALLWTPLRMPRGGIWSMGNPVSPYRCPGKHPGEATSAPSVC